MCGAVAAETDKLKYETPKGRRIKPPFFFERAFEQSRAGGSIGRSAADTVDGWDVRHAESWKNLRSECSSSFVSFYCRIQDIT